MQVLFNEPMKTYGLKRKRRDVSPARVHAIRDPLEEPSKLPSITEYIDKLIDASPELLKPPTVLEKSALSQSSLDTIMQPSETGMVFISQPSQVGNMKIYILPFSSCLM